MENRHEYWTFDPNGQWIIILENEKRDKGAAYNTYIAATKQRFALAHEEAVELLKQNQWREILKTLDHQIFFSIWMDWREYRKPIESQQKAELDAARTILLEIYNFIPQLDVQDMHRIQSQAAGVRYLGVRHPEETEKTRWHRKSYCWNCRRGLDNYRDYECLSCNWILCSCGACECGRFYHYECPCCGVGFRNIDCRGSFPFCSPNCRYSALQEYSEYLRSPEWSRRREFRLVLDKHLCQDCSDPASEVHHLTYERIGNEHIDDLISLCRECHAIRHGDLGFVSDRGGFLRKLTGLRF